MAEHSKDKTMEDEENKEVVYQVQCYFKTNIENTDYHVPDTVITLESDFTRKKLNKIVHKLLEDNVESKVNYFTIQKLRNQKRISILYQLLIEEKLKILKAKKIWMENFEVLAQI